MNKKKYVARSILGNTENILVPSYLWGIFHDEICIKKDSYERQTGGEIVENKGN